MSSARGMTRPKVERASERGREAGGPRGLGRARRFAELVRIGRRHGVLPWGRLDFTTRPEHAELRARQADGMRRALEQAGGAFIKIGQLYSTRTDLLPVEWAEALSHLQKDVAPEPWADIEALLVAELGSPVEAVFREFEREPIAAASIGQVHLATLRTGRRVAVKVQRPGIVGAMERDIDIALRTVRAVERTSARAREIRIVEVAEQYAADLRRQLDFRLEASNLLALRATHASSPRAGEVRLPELVEAHSTDRVVVMELLDGDTIAHVVARGRAAGADAEAGADGGPAGGPARGPAGAPQLDGAMRAVLRAFIRQVVIDGVYHSDLHPGNILVGPDGVPALVDFGSVGRLDLQQRESAQELLIAYLQSDAQRIADGVLALAPLRPGSDEGAFRRELATFVSYRLGRGARIDVVVVDELVSLFLRYGLTVPADMIAAIRGAAILEGTLRTVLPEFDLLAEARGIADEQIRDQMRPDAVRDLVAAELLALLPTVRKLPRRLDRVGTALEQGTLVVQARILADRDDRRFLGRLVRRTVCGSLSAAAGVTSLLLLTVPPGDGGVLSTAAAGGIAGVAAAGLLVAALVRGR